MQCSEEKARLKSTREARLVGLLVIKARTFTAHGYLKTTQSSRHLTYEVHFAEMIIIVDGDVL